MLQIVSFLVMYRIIAGCEQDNEFHMPEQGKVNGGLFAGLTPDERSEAVRNLATYFEILRRWSDEAKANAEANSQE